MLKKLKLYAQLMRWHRPIGIGLLLWPTLWAMWIAGQGHPTLRLVSIFILGTILMRSAGCVINDIADRKIDCHIPRTNQRPLTSGQINVKEASVLFIILLLASATLLIELNNFTRLLALLSAGLAILYPFTKRWTNWPQIIFACTWSMGILMAFAAQLNTLPAVSWLIYVINALWSFMYDTEYAMADRPADLKIGVKSSAIGLGSYDRLVLGLLQLLVTSLLGWLGYLLKMSNIYYATVAIAGLIFIYQSYLIRRREPLACFNAFRSNQWIGTIIYIGIISQSNNIAYLLN